MKMSGITGSGVAAALLLAAAPGPAMTPASTQCPPGGEELPPGASLQAAIDRAPRGGILCLAPGLYAGPVEIHRPVTLLGPASAEIQSDGTRTTVRVGADSVVLQGFTVRGSGRRYDLMDGAVYLHGNDIQVRGLRVQDALFGIVVERSNRVVLADNWISGLAELPVGIRGDGIRLWEVRGSLVAGNRLEDSRDLLVWYSPGNRILNNRVVRSRYATHFMYSDSCIVEGGNYRENIVGVFVMYARNITLRNDTIIDNAGVDGMGLGVKESGNLVVEDSQFLHDNACIYLDTSPFRAGDSMVVQRNTFARCNAAITFHSSEHGNTFRDNNFEANQVQVAVEGRGTAREVDWRGNYFDDYQGYDLNRDGRGDVPYELRSLSEHLVADHPQLAIFRGTIAFTLLDAVARIFPLMQPETVLVDPAPRVSPRSGP